MTEKHFVQTMRSYARGTKAVLLKVLIARVCEAHFCSIGNGVFHIRRCFAKLRCDGSKDLVTILLQISQKRLKYLKNMIKYRRSSGKSSVPHIRNCKQKGL